MNVVAFVPRVIEQPALAFAEVRLDDACNLELRVYDEAGNVEVIEFARITELSQASFDRLLAAWARWKDNSSVAS